MKEMPAFNIKKYQNLQALNPSPKMRLHNESKFKICKHLLLFTQVYHHLIYVCLQFTQLLSGH